MLRAAISRILATFRRRRLEHDFDEEVRMHLDLLAERLIAKGMDPAEAAYAARRQFGGLTQVKENLRSRRALPSWDLLARDFRHAFRQLRRAKWFTASVTLTLALGIGATTTVFALLDAVVLRPLPYAAPDSLVSFGVGELPGTPHSAALSYPVFFDFRRENRVFEHLVSYRDSRFTLGDSLPAIQVTGEIVSWDLFPLLGTQPELGRGFLPEEEKPGTSVVVLSDALWKRRYGADKQILGRPIQINGRPFTVIGVAPPGFQFPLDLPAVQLWVPLAEDAAAAGQPGARMLDAIGRLKPGVSMEQARAQTGLVATTLAGRYPKLNKSLAATWVLPELDRLSGGSRRPLWMLLGAVALVLLIACADIANLLLARGTERAREFVLRAALGASRPALVRQLFIESLALGLLGAAGGILLAWAAIHGFLPLTGGSLPTPRLIQAGIDGRVLAFSVFLTLLTSIVFSLGPVFDAIRADPSGALKEGAANIAPGPHRFRSALVVAQIALGLVLLAGAELLVASFLHMAHRDPGFRTERLLTFDVGLPEAHYDVPAQIAFSGRLIDRLRAIPGVLAVAAGRPLPLQGHEMRAAFDIEERRGAVTDRPRSDIAIVTPGYFGVMGIPLLKGRDFSQSDAAGTPPILVVNEAFARKFFPGENAVGKRIQSGAGPTAVMREIVGVAGDTRQAPLGTDADPICYFPYKQLPWGLGTVVLRTAVPPFQVESAVRDALAGLDRQAAMNQVRTGEDLSAAALALIQFPMVLMTSFAAAALLLTVTGLYGVLSYAVARRRREIGVRMALGAGRAEVLGLVLGDAGRLVAAGLILGSAGAFGAARLLENMVYGVRPGDPLIVAGACCLMVITSLAAAYVPAARAVSVDPTQALRSE